MRLRHAQVKVGGASQLLVSGAGRLAYVNCRESTGVSAAGFDLLDGDTTSNRVIYTANLAASESVRDNFPGFGIPFDTGVNFVNRTGTQVVVVYFALEWEWMDYETVAEAIARTAR